MFPSDFSLNSFKVVSLVNEGASLISFIVESYLKVTFGFRLGGPECKCSPLFLVACFSIDGRGSSISFKLCCFSIVLISGGAGVRFLLSSLSLSV
jgi:hypothetical protein